MSDKLREALELLRAFPSAPNEIEGRITKVGSSRLDHIADLINQALSETSPSAEGEIEARARELLAKELEVEHPTDARAIRRGMYVDCEAAAIRAIAKALTAKTSPDAVDGWLRVAELEEHIRSFIYALDRGYLSCKDDSAFIDALRQSVAK